ncbi:zinc-ribbon domain-containing protein [Ruicaihuangia caeni]|uniref:zinc-ribbon domain-containing protein n=1 Tax=Ruicaihuangia caeni TaxID=3042517 RepID=UPI00338F5B06
MTTAGMVCERCGAELPSTAMFCGECGATVTAPARNRAAAAAALHCDACGQAMGPNDIFCAQCGHVASSVTEAWSMDAGAAGRARQPGQGDLSARAADGDRAAATADSLPAIVEPGPTLPSAGVSSDTMPVAGDALERPVAAGPHGFAPPGDPVEHDATRVVRKASRLASFVLQFSTGEQFTVTGRGLIGRNPQPEPAEHVEHLVVIRDPARSVSKTHLEFGQEDGGFWVLDRFSGNGSVVRVPDAEPRRCEGGKRYAVPRGTRVDIGDQFFVIS